MPAITDGLRHEIFCTPRPEQTEPRIERFPYYRDEGGRLVTVQMVRCIECGALRINP